jgi:hypothetical protein
MMKFYLKDSSCASKKLHFKKEGIGGKTTVSTGNHGKTA